MSAYQWRKRLEECQEKLGASTISAQEWKKVAENRLILLQRLDSAITEHLLSVAETGVIFGVTHDIEAEAWESTKGFSGGQLASYIMGKIEIASIYTRDLMKEAAAVQVTLSDTYDHACKALEVGRPTDDLTIPDITSHVSVPSSPLRDLVDELNSDSPPTSCKRSDLMTRYAPQHTEIVHDHAEQALALFKK